MKVTRSTKELTGPIMGMDIMKEKINSTKKCVKRDYTNQKKGHNTNHLGNSYDKQTTEKDDCYELTSTYHRVSRRNELKESVTNCFVSKVSMNNPYSFGSVGSRGDSYS